MPSRNAMLIFAAILPIATSAQSQSIDTRDVSVRAELEQGGRITITWPDGTCIENATASVVVDGVEHIAADFARHECDPLAIVRTPRGNAHRLVVRSVSDAIQIDHVVDVHEADASVTVLAMVRRKNGAAIATNQITPLLIREDRGSIRLGGAPIRQILSVPYDNDEYSRYDAAPAKGGLTKSSEVIALYNDNSRRAVIIGSITHDIWKTGIVCTSLNDEWIVITLRVFGGKSDEQTHDHEPHGTVSGTTVSSPTLFIAASDDWRDGMVAYGKANAAIRPALPWDGGVPFGWNSWAAHKSELSNEKVEAAIELVDALRTKGFENHGTAYVNLDSFWDKLSDEQLKRLIDDTHRRGMKFGLYWTPFCFWGDEPSLSRQIEKTDGKYTFLDAVLKGADGKPLPKRSGAFALDPTHPGTQARNAALYARFVALGVDFVKLDFLSHGALEGRHFDTAVQTGTQAYHAGMSDVLSAFDENKTGRPIFISLSIAPLFPHGYGHSRRMTCDVFASLDATKYLLNGLTYSFWTHGTLYAFNDPDHTVVHHVHDEKPVSEAVATTRLNTSLISGGMLLGSDDAGDPDARDRVIMFFTMPPLVDLARTAQTFRPVEGNAGHEASSTFVLKSGEAMYLAVFNFDEKATTTLRIKLSRIGLDPRAVMRLVDLANGTAVATSKDGTFEIVLQPAASHVLRIEDSSASR